MAGEATSSPTTSPAPPATSGCMPTRFPDSDALPGAECIAAFEAELRRRSQCVLELHERVSRLEGQLDEQLQANARRLDAALEAMADICEVSQRLPGTARDARAGQII